MLKNPASASCKRLLQSFSASLCSTVFFRVSPRNLTTGIIPTQKFLNTERRCPSASGPMEYYAAHGNQGQIRNAHSLPISSSPAHRPSTPNYCLNHIALKARRLSLRIRSIYSHVQRRSPSSAILANASPTFNYLNQWHHSFHANGGTVPHATRKQLP